MHRSILALALLLTGSCALAIEINHASEADLDGLKGIGPALSARILQARDQVGPFANWSDLMRRVKGIGTRSARQLSEAGLTVNGEPYAPPPPRPATSSP